MSKRFVRQDKVPLCACGCKKQVQWNMVKKKWNKFINYHSSRTFKFFNKFKCPPLCECGCKESVKWNCTFYNWNKFINGHNRRKQVFSKEHRKNLSLSQIGRKHSKETKRKLSLIGMGKKLSDKTKKKMSLAQTGKKLSDETKKKLSLVHIGKKFSDETRRKIGLKSKGRKPSNETRLKMSLASSGSNSSQWRGGISCEPYCSIWADQEYKESIKKRDNYTCQNPNCKSNCNHLLLNIHHINYVKKNCHPWNLITLCVGCNFRANKNRKDHTIFYQNIMAKKYGYKYEENYGDNGEVSPAPWKRGEAGSTPASPTRIIKTIIKRDMAK